MEKKWRNIPTTEISADPANVSCRPTEAVALTLRTDSPDDVRVELGLPLDVRIEPADLVIRGGLLNVELRAALPGSYAILFKGAAGGAGEYLIRTGDKIAHHFDGKPYPIAHLEVRWGAART